MGLFGKVRDFLFETEAQLLIKAELETQRVANKKLFDWNEKLQSHNNELEVKMGKVLNKLDEQNTWAAAHNDSVEQSIVELKGILRSVLERNEWGSINDLIEIQSNELKSITRALTDNHIDVYNKFEGQGELNKSLYQKVESILDVTVAFNHDMVQDHLKRVSDTIIRSRDDLQSIIRALAENHIDVLRKSNDTSFMNAKKQIDDIVEKYIDPMYMKLDGHDKTIHKSLDRLSSRLDGMVKEFVDHDSTIKGKLNLLYGDMNKRGEITNEMITNYLDRTKSDLDLLISTLGNVEEVVTHPKPHSDMMELASRIQSSVEHINGFLDSEEYKQQWDMKQVQTEMRELRVLLECVEAFMPTPSGNTQAKILELFASTDQMFFTPKMMVNELGYTKKQVYSALGRMTKNGSLVLLGRGQYTLPNVGEKLAGDEDETPNPRRFG